MGKEEYAMLDFMNLEPMFWIGMGVVALVICLMQVICWTMAPKAQRHV